MPFGGLLTVGTIGAAGSLGSAAIGAHGAGSAGRALQAMGNRVGGSIDKATQDAINAGYYGMGQASNAMTTGLTDASSAVRTGLSDASSAVAGNYGAANTALGQAYADQMAQLSPYIQGGTQGFNQLAAFMAPGGAGSKQFQWDPANDPGYQFRLDEATKNMLKTASSRGGLGSGGFAKALDRYSQDYASNEYQNAFNRYMQGQAQQYNMLSGLAGFGQNATAEAVNAAGNYGRGVSGNFGQVGNQLGAMNYGAGNTLANLNYGTGTNLANMQMQGNQWVGNTGLQGAQAAGNAYMGGALQGAQGKLASANAWGQGLSGAANLAGGLIYNNYLNNQNQPAGAFQAPGGYAQITPQTVIDPASLGPAPQIVYTPPPLPTFLQG